MNKPIKLAVAGLGRMGLIHALHVHELAKETRNCTLAALCDVVPGRAEQIAAGLGADVPIFHSIEELAAAGVADATVIVTPTDRHREHAAALIASGQRVLVEKPLTGVLETELEFAADLDKTHPHALMLGFQRRFAPPFTPSGAICSRFDGPRRHRADLQDSLGDGRLQPRTQRLQERRYPVGY